MNAGRFWCTQPLGDVQQDLAAAVLTQACTDSGIPGVLKQVQTPLLPPFRYTGCLGSQTSILLSSWVGMADPWEGEIDFSGLGGEVRSTGPRSCC